MTGECVKWGLEGRIRKALTKEWISQYVHTEVERHTRGICSLRNCQSITMGTDEL